ncbi:hypothetical protein PZBJ_20340 [Pantoea endophytica]|uniref:Uncharacterized protein n=1 Tax=Pantoea endophytica TaxID=92488 RepID=A0ABX4SMB4_9GAMM|nr:hypothetical protein [Pantoea endophytica]PLR20403.1 hypothetical protein PZBJ_20340 [Pantoea endophytica]
MSEILSFLTGGWNYVLAALAVVAALLTSYFGGKKVGTVQTQAKADVAAAEKDKSQVEEVAKKQSENAEAAKNVQSINSGISDSAARDKLQRSKYNSAD